MINSFKDAQLIFTERDGFAPPKLGGAVNVKWGAFTIADTTARKLYTLPAGAQIVGWIVAIGVVFDAGTSAVVDIGDGETDDRFGADIDVKTPGVTNVTEGFDGSEMFAALAEDTDVYVKYAESGTTGTTGVAALGCMYVIVDEDEGFAAPLLGGAVNAQWGSFDFENVAESEAELFTLPAGAQIIGWAIAPTEGFDATTPTVDLGDGETADLFGDGLALANDTKVITEGFAGDAMYTALAGETTVYATYAEASGGSAGAAVVGVFYTIVDES